MTDLHHPDLSDVELPAVLQALGDPVRLQIVQALAAEGERACGTIELDVSKATRSHHLKVLREAGVTATRPQGTKKFVSLRRDELEARFPGLLESVLAARPV